MMRFAKNPTNLVIFGLSKKPEKIHRNWFSIETLLRSRPQFTFHVPTSRKDFQPSIPGPPHNAVLKRKHPHTYRVFNPKLRPIQHLPFPLLDKDFQALSLRNPDNAVLKRNSSSYTAVKHIFPL